jgi:hypothetical protein
MFFIVIKFISNLIILMNFINFMILIIILNLSSQENRVRTLDPLTLGPDARPKRIES